MFQTRSDVLTWYCWLSCSACSSCCSRRCSRVSVHSSHSGWSTLELLLSMSNSLAVFCQYFLMYTGHVNNDSLLLITHTGPDNKDRFSKLALCLKNEQYQSHMPDRQNLQIPNHTFQKEVFLKIKKN